MNRVWAIKAEQRLSQLEQRCKALNERADALLQKYLALLERLDALEAKRGPGRPPKDKTE